MINTIFNMHKIRFDKLDTLDIMDKVKPSKKVNVFINLEMVFRKLCTPKVNEFIMVSDSTDLKIDFIANIINLAQHYRLYFAKKKINASVYMYWNYPKTVLLNRIILDSYKEKWFSKLNESIKISFVLESIHTYMDTMIKYIQNIYLMNVEYIESSLVPYIIYKNGNETIPNIIVSNDLYDFQYIKYGFSILNPRGEKSVLIDNESVYKYITKSDNYNDMDVRVLPFVITLMGLSNRSIESMKGYGASRSLSLIRDGIKNYTIGPDTDNIDLLIKLIDESNANKISSNFQMVDIKYQYNRLSDGNKHMILSMVEDRHDDSKINSINEKYFQRNPIMMVNVW